MFRSKRSCVRMFIWAVWGMRIKKFCNVDNKKQLDWVLIAFNVSLRNNALTCWIDQRMDQLSINGCAVKLRGDIHDEVIKRGIVWKYEYI